MGLLGFAPLFPYEPLVLQVDALAPRVGAPGSQVAAVEHVSSMSKPAGQWQSYEEAELRPPPELPGDVQVPVFLHGPFPPLLSQPCEALLPGVPHRSS